MNKWNKTKRTTRIGAMKELNVQELFTERQWAKKGFLKKSENCGKMLWSNRNCAKQFLYLLPEEVYKANQAELNEYFKPERDRRNQLQKKRILQERKEYEEREQLLKQRIEALKKESKQRIEMLNKTNDYLISLMKNVQSIDVAETIVIDTETTGLNPEKDELLQVSIISSDGRILFNSYIKPKEHMNWKSAEEINGITPQMVKNAPTIDDVMPQIMTIIKYAKVIIGYNVNFDLGFIQTAGCSIPNDTNIVDVMTIFARIYGEYSDYFRDYKWQKLTVCADYYGYDWGFDTAHNSLSDCKATLFCYKKIME